MFVAKILYVCAIWPKNPVLVWTQIAKSWWLCLWLDERNVFFFFLACLPSSLLASNCSYRHLVIAKCHLLQIFNLVPWRKFCPLTVFGGKIHLHSLPGRFTAALVVVKFLLNIYFKIINHGYAHLYPVPELWRSTHFHFICICNPVIFPMLTND